MIDYLKKPANIELKKKHQTIIIKGPLGKGCITLPKKVNLSYTKDRIYLYGHGNDNHKFFTCKTILKNLTIGLSLGHTKVLKLSGLGYKASIHKQLLYLRLGNSHNTFYLIPKDILAKTVNNKYIVLTSIDLQKLNQTIHQIKKIKKLDPYKGKGIVETNTRIHLKATKKK